MKFSWEKTAKDTTKHTADTLKQAAREAREEVEKNGSDIFAPIMTEDDKILAKRHVEILLSNEAKNKKSDAKNKRREQANKNLHGAQSQPGNPTI